MSVGTSPRQAGPVQAIIFAAQVAPCDKRHWDAFIISSFVLLHLHPPPTAANQPTVAGCRERETLSAVMRTTWMKFKNKSLQLPEPRGTFIIC